MDTTSPVAVGVPLGRTGLPVSRLGLGASYGLGQAGVLRAVERGVNYLYWGSMRRPSFGRGVREAARRDRERLVIVIQSYTRLAALLGPSLRLALRRLGIEYADVLLLGWWNREPSRRIVDAGRALVQRGLVRHLGVSTHERPLAPVLAREAGPYGVLHVRYNAAHRGAERDIFPFLPAPPGGPGIVAFTATRWGTLLSRPRGVPPDVPWPTATDCYRFCLTDPHVHVVLAGPANEGELEGALLALDKGPLDPDELARVRRAGDAVYGRGWAPG